MNTYSEIAFGVAIVAAAYAWFFIKATMLLKGWATKHQYRIVSKRLCILFRGPFWWTHLLGLAVYEVTVEDEICGRRFGWVCCGDKQILGTRNIRVRWKDERHVSQGQAHCR